MAILEPSNNTKNFMRAKGKTVLKQVPVVASTAFEQGTALAPNGSWVYVLAPVTATTWVVILNENILSTDSDYATSGKLKTVQVPVENDVEFYFNVWAWTFTSADVWNVCQLHTDGKSLAVDTSTNRQFQITGYISATKWKARLLAY